MRRADLPHRILLVLSLGFVVLLSAPAFSAKVDKTHSWREIRRNKDIIIYQKRNSDHKWISTRGVCLANAPIEVVTTYFKDIAKARRITPHCKEKRILKSYSARDRIEYSRYKLIWPFKDRYIIHRQREMQPAAGTIVFRIDDTDAVAMEVPGKLRARTRNGRFELEAVDQHRTQVMIETNLHTGGTLPKWLIRLATRLWLHDMLMNLKQALKKEMAGKEFAG